MPLDADERWDADQVLSGAEIRAIIERRWPLEELPAPPSSTARRFRFADGAGELGFVSPVSEPFCSSCDRIRLTADGQLRTCLFSRTEWDLRAPLRDGATDPELEEVIRNAVAHKELPEPNFRSRTKFAGRRPLAVMQSPLQLAAGGSADASSSGDAEARHDAEQHAA